MPLSLHSVQFANAGAPPLVVLHGLLGSSRNWTSIGRKLQKSYDVHLVDLRNHGNSPHADSMRWAELSTDVQRYLDQHELDSVVLLGHSLGGKVAMRLACDYPKRVRRLFIADIAAKTYPPYHEAEFRAMRSLNLSELGSRREAEQLLESLVADWGMRQFLLTNLVRDEATQVFRWLIHLEALYKSLPHIRQSPMREGDRYEGPVLLLRGGQSDFIQEGDAEAMQAWFPQLREVVLPEAGHNLHFDDRDGFLTALIMPS
jgi:esterase|tara:strand:- start:1265 stop:2041 length:777 start_codon:yes stop_codon:yes gene_type:complete